jgi:FemAB-related protein (PEP-CTERM system-associated)
MTLLAPASRQLVSTTPELTVQTYAGAELAARLPALTAFATAGTRVPLSRHPGWLVVLRDGLSHEPYAVEAIRKGRTVGVMALACVRSLLFGRYLVSLPYLNSGGTLAEDANVAAALTDRAVELADRLRVRYLELRHEWALDHPALGHRRTDKVHMRLELPETPAALWEQLNCKVRNQVRKGQKGGFTVHWGGADLLPEFYAVFSRNMRDLGTPTYGRGLFAAILRQFPSQSEVCVVRDGDRPAAAALLLHGPDVTEVPSASSLKTYNSRCANMLLYWHLLERAVQRGQEVFDFGRSSEGCPTYRFKKQWGATGSPAEWQYYLRRGSADHVRPENPRYRRLIEIWRRLPLWLTRTLGPCVVRGIP